MVGKTHPNPKFDKGTILFIPNGLNTSIKANIIET